MAQAGISVALTSPRGLPTQKVLATSGAKAGTNLMMKTINIRFWIGTLALAGAVAYALALFIATPGAAAGGGSEETQSNSGAQSSRPAQSSPTQSSPAQSMDVQPQTYDGVITDTHCEAKHSAPLAESAAECTRVCVHSGERFALVDGDKLYVLEGEPVALKRAAGERVRIAGTLNGNTISVTSVVAPKS